MATDVTKTPTPPPVQPQTSPSNVAEQFIERQLDRTRMQVKLVDLASATMLLVTSVIAYLLVLAIIDHWLFDLGFWGRVLALVTLVVAAAYFCFAHLAPLMFRSINPMYAAQTIERASPSLKNSLINFLMLRRQRAGLHAVVYRALEHKAATDLTTVPSDTVVDRSNLIKIGYILVAVLAVGALYKIISPKDPFRTVARVATPWKEIARPSSVEVLSVQPGDAEAFQGQIVDISAEVRGLGRDAAVTLVYSTIDGQTTDQTMPMQLADGGLRYQCQVPPESDGIQQDVRYRIEAGDARSREFQITVSPAPTILVERVEYDFPKYTKRKRIVIDRDGNIRAVEGTAVTIRARANHEIRSARIEFDPLSQDGAARIGTADGVESMQVDGVDAWRRHVLELQPDRRTPKHSSYQLAYVTKQGHRSQKPILHQIQVIPDLAPEVNVLTPERDQIEVPADGRQRIEVRAVDPDFGLSRIKLRMISGGSDLLDTDLFDDPAGQLGQRVVNYEFVPSLLGLEAGDRVSFWAVAEDNRTVADQSAPNSNRSRNYRITIVPAKGNRTSADRGGSDSPEDEPDEKGEGSGAGDSGAGSGEGGTEGSSQEGGGEGDSDQKEGGTEEGQPQAGGSETGSAQGEPDSAEQQEGTEGGSGANAKGEGQSQDGESGETPQSGGSSPQSDGAGGTAGSAGKPPRDEPLHDGEVIEKVMERLQKDQSNGTNGGQSSGQPGGQRQPDSGTGEGSGQGDSTKSQQSNPSSPNDNDPMGEAEEGSETDPSQDNFKKFETGDRENGDRKNKEPRSSDGAESGRGQKNEDLNQGAGAQKDGNPGEGGQSSPKQGTERNEGEPRDVEGPKDGRKKDPGIGDNGESGAGQNSEDTSGSASVEETSEQESQNRDRRKTEQPDSTEPTEPSDPGGNTSKRQSDTQGGESGDQSGGGKKGPGQGANQAGNDSAGSNSSSDDGAGASQEAGSGETADSPGQKELANGETGSQSEKKGKGSGTTEDQGGDRTGDGDPGAEPMPGQDQEQPEREPGGNSGSRSGGAGGPPIGGGLDGGQRQSSGADPAFQVPEGDAANLDYANRATDMVVEYLRDQEDRPDEDLLRDLGWSPEDLRNFVDRWQRLKQSAREGAGGERQLNESLRSLGLRPKGDRTRRGDVRKDELRGLQDSGDESKPPAAYEGLFRAFKKGRARAAN